MRQHKRAVYSIKIAIAASIANDIQCPLALLNNLLSKVKKVIYLITLSCAYLVITKLVFPPPDYKACKLKILRRLTTVMRFKEEWGIRWSIRSRNFSSIQFFQIQLVCLRLDWNEEIEMLRNMFLFWFNFRCNHINTFAMSH